MRARGLNRSNSQTWNNRDGIEGISGLFQIKADRLIAILFSCSMNENLTEFGGHFPGTCIVRMRERVASDGSTNAGMTAFHTKGANTGINVAETFSVGESSECYGQQLTPTGKARGVLVTLVASVTLAKFEHRNIVHELSENEAPFVHGASLAIVLKGRIARESRDLKSKSI